MNITYNKFLIAFAIMVLLGSSYVYFSHGLDAQAALGLTSDSSLQSSTTPLYTSSSDAKIAADTAFLASLTSLTKITIDTSLFEKQSFKILKDNNVKLDPVVSGRPNPFIPIDPSATLASASVLPVRTNAATQVTDKSAVLNGLISNTLGVTGAYFEYGPTTALGKTTREANVSLVGTFVTSVTGLAPKTAYFFRAAARVNKTVLYGDVISFTTN